MELKKMLGQVYKQNLFETVSIKRLEEYCDATNQCVEFNPRTKRMMFKNDKDKWKPLKVKKE